MFTTRTGRPLDGGLVTRDLKTILASTWIGGSDPECVHARVRPDAQRRTGHCLDCSASHLPVISFHALRHSCATVLLAAGVPTRDVSDLLGHSDVRLTLSTYSHVIEANRAAIAGRLDDMFDTTRTGRQMG